jgi:hypothetical protein
VREGVREGIMEDQSPPARIPSRRRLITGAGGLTLAGAALGLVSGCTGISLGETKSNGPVDDAAVVSSVLGLEYQAVAAYEAALSAGALAEPEAAMARAFQADHVKHAEALVHTIIRLQGKPVTARDAPEYRFAAAELKTRDDVLRFLVGFEQGLALAHLGAVPAFAEKGLAKSAAGILGVEAMHWGALRRALGEEPVPAPFLG